MTLSSEERDELRTTARALLSRSCSSQRVREVILTDSGFDADLWAQFVDLGWTAIHVDERHGGAGCGFGDLAVIVHELGRAVTPSPFLASTVLATGALLGAEEGELRASRLAALADGSAIGTVAFATADGTYEADQLVAAWRSDGDNLVLSGLSGFVLNADVADFIIVAAPGPEDDLAMLLVDVETAGLARERIPMVDQTRRVFTVSFDDVRVPSRQLLCDPGPAAARLLDRVLTIGIVAAACDAAGVAERTLEMTAAYARERTQFGKPIGSFQAVKHHCANMAINVEASRAACTAAAAELDDDSASCTTTASITASYVGPACSEACALGMRVHGGIGFTWEHDMHLLMKRAKLDEVLFGRPSWHRRRLADAVFPMLLAQDDNQRRNS